MFLFQSHRDIIEHRPDDCIIECLSDTYNDDSQWSEEQVSDAISSLRTKLGQTNLLRFNELSELEQTVMVDIINGSTAAACMVENSRERCRKDRVEPQHVEEYIAICKAGQQLAKECQTTFPEC